MANSMVDSQAAAEVKKALRRLTIGIAILYIGMLGTAGWVYMNSQSNTDALCALRNDLQERVDNSEAFIEKHPNGFAGISPREIKDGINGQKRTIKALSGISC